MIASGALSVANCGQRLAFVLRLHTPNLPRLRPTTASCVFCDFAGVMAFDLSAGAPSCASRKLEHRISLPLHLVMALWPDMTRTWCLVFFICAQHPFQYTLLHHASF